MAGVKEIVVFQRNKVEPEEFQSNDERRISGECRQSVSNHYSDPSGQFHAGIWTGGVGKWKVRYTEHEFCTLLEGHCLLSDEQGNSLEIKAGDHFVIPAGFAGTWEVLEPARKTYAIFEPK